MPSDSTSPFYGFRELNTKDGKYVVKEQSLDFLESAFSSASCPNPPNTMPWYTNSQSSKHFGSTTREKLMSLRTLTDAHLTGTSCFSTGTGSFSAQVPKKRSQTRNM